MDMRKNEKGSSLIFALAVIMIITMVIAACMAISYSYYKRSIVANSERQAYLTAKSVLTEIVDNINDKYSSIIPNDDATEPFKLSIKNFPTEMGSIENASMQISQITENEEKKKILTISITVKYGNSIKNLSADLAKKPTEKTWSFRKYYEGNPVLSPNITNASRVEDNSDVLKKLFSGLLTKTDSEKKEAVNKLKTGKDTKNIFESAVSNAGDKDTINITNSYISNDALRKIIYYGIYNGNWPKYDFGYSTIDQPTRLVKDETGKNVTEYVDYYIQVYFVEKNFDRYLIYASPYNVATGKWSGVNMAYLNGKWYYNPKKSIALTSLSKGTQADIDQAWKDIVEVWLSDSDTKVIE